MQDQQRVDFIERMRVLYADIFRDGDEAVFHENKLLDVPDYLRDECVVELTSKASNHSMDEAASCALEAFVADNGIASCRDAATGKLHWRHRLGGNFSSSLVHAGGTLWIVSEQGVCTAFAADPTEYRELGSGDMGEQVLASLAAAGGAFFLRTEGHLYRIE